MSHSSAVGDATPFINPFLSNQKKAHTRGNKLFIEPPAKRFFDKLNGYEKAMVAKGIEDLRSIKSPLDGAGHRFRLHFWRMKKDPGVVGNYLISYEVFSGKVVVTRIAHNEDMLFGQVPEKNERNAMYHIQRLNNAQFNSQFLPTKKNIADLKVAWGNPRPTTRIDTTHAAVNGMQNEFRKALWLMGVHIDYAYQTDNIADYTLFHNPTETKWPDLYESACDQLGITTENAKHLCAVLRQIQNRGKAVKWLAHSQGAIIFAEAIRYHLKNGGGSLHHNSIVFHAGGNRKGITDELLHRVNIEKLKPDNDNPYDIVPNIGGMNDLSQNGIKRSLRFRKKVWGNKSKPEQWREDKWVAETESPHTLPFISLEFYRRMLIHGGEYELAKKVKRYMDTIGTA